MGPYTKISSIAINLTHANNEVGMVECDEFSISGFIAEIRDTHPTTCWPFPEESASLGWWPRLSYTRNTDADGTNDSGLPSNSRPIISTNGLNGSSSIIPSQSELNSPTAIDQEKERNTDIAGNAAVVNEDVNCERSQNDDQIRDNPVVENEDVNRERSQQNDQTGNAVGENEDVNCERSQKDDQTGNNALVVNERSQKDDQRTYTYALRSSKKVHPPPRPLRTYALRNKSTKKAVAEPLGNKRAEKQPNVEKLAVTETETAACAEDAQPEETTESRSLFIGGAPSRRARKVRTRTLADLTGNPQTRSVENVSRKESLRGQKRKSPPRSSRKASTAGAASGSASKTVESAHGGSEPTDENGFDTDTIKGKKKKNVRFQDEDELDSDFEVDEELDSDFEVDDEDDPDPYPPRAKRTKKDKIAKKKSATTAVDPSNKASSSAQPALNENETVPSPPREERTEERVGTSLDDQLASDGYVRKTNPPPVNERQDNSRMRLRQGEARSYVPVFGNPSIPNTGRGLGTGPGAIYFGSSSNNNNNNQRSTTPSTVAAAEPTVPQKDASTPNTRGLRTGAGATYLGGSSSNKNNLRSTPSSTQVASQSTVPQKDASTPNTGRALRTGSGAILFGSSSNNNNSNNLRSNPSSSQVAAQSTVPQKDASTPNTYRRLRSALGSGAISLGGSSNNNNNLRSTPSSSQVASQSTVPQKDASTPNTYRRLRSGSGTIYLGGSSNNNNNNNLRSTPSSSQVASQSTVPQKDASTPNTGRRLGTGAGAIYLSGSSSRNNNQRNTPPTRVAAQSSVQQKDASTPNTRRGLGTGLGAINYLGSSSRNSNSNNLRSTPLSTAVASQPSVPQKDASIPNTRRGLGTGLGPIYLGSSSRNSNINNLRSTPPSIGRAAQPSVPHMDASIPNTRRGFGTGLGDVYLGSSSRNSNSNNLRSTPPFTGLGAQPSVPQKDAFIPNTGRELGTGQGALYIGSRTNNNNYQRSTPPTVVTAQSSVQQKDASVSDRKGKGVMVESHDETEKTQKPKTPFLFDLNETYEEDTSLEENTSAARQEDRVPVRSEQTPRHNSYMASSSVMPPPPPVQESRRSSIPFPSHNPQWMGNVPMASPYHHPSPSTYQAIRAPHQFRAPSPPVWASSMTPPQYHHPHPHPHHHHHLTPPPPAPFNMDYSSMFAQPQSSDAWNLSYYGANLLNQAMMSGMDPRFRPNTPVDHHGNFIFPPRHVHPVNQFNQLVELQRSQERAAPVMPRTISNQGRFQRRRNAASSSNASTSRAVNSYDSSACIVSRYPGEISDIEPGNVYLVPQEDLHVPERMAELFEYQAGPVTESG